MNGNDILRRDPPVKRLNSIQNDFDVETLSSPWLGFQVGQTLRKLQISILAGVNLKNATLQIFKQLKQLGSWAW